MNEFKKQIDSQLMDFTFECDVEQIHAKYKKRKKLQRTAVLSFMCLLLAGFILLPKVPSKTGNNFELTVYAADKEYTVDSEIALPELTFKLHKNGNYSIFSETGEEFFGVKGENIKTVAYTSKIAEFMSYAEGKHFKEYRFDYDPENPELCYVKWIYWDEEKILDPKNPDYTKIPKDTITIEATFTNGETVKKAFELSFDKKGSMAIKKLSDNMTVDLSNHFNILFRVDKKDIGTQAHRFADNLVTDSVFPEALIRAYEIPQENGEMKYNFNLSYKREFGITGSNIDTVVFISENNQLFDAKTQKNVSEIKFDYKKEFLNECYVEWTLPKNIDSWCKEANINKSYDFTEIPKDRLTVKITYTNGKTTEIISDLYFNKYGYLVMDVL